MKNKLRSFILLLSLLLNLHSLPEFILSKAEKNKGWGLLSFAQNTFRYQIHENNNGPDSLYFIANSGRTLQVPYDSGYVIFGHAGRVAPGVKVPNGDFPVEGGRGITRFDKYANVLWSKLYYDPLNPPTPSTSEYPPGNNGGSSEEWSEVDGIPTADSGFIMAGRRRGFKENDNSNSICSSVAGFHTFIQKTDKNGNLLWSKLYRVHTNTSDHQNGATKILQLPDEGFIVMGQTRDITYSGLSTSNSCIWPNSYNTYLLRLDKNGNTSWCYVYDAEKNGEELPTSLDVCSDGGFIIGGSAYVDWSDQASNSRSNAFTVDTFMASTKGFMMKVSSNGQVEWAKRYGKARDNLYTSQSIGLEAFDETKQTTDGGYIAVGYTLGDIPTNRQNGDWPNYSGWVVKTNAQGVIEWQKSYNTSFAINKVEAGSDGYVLAATDGLGRLTKINLTGEVQWSKLYEGSMVDLNKTMDNGFILNTGGNGTLRTGIYRADVIVEPTIMKTNLLGEFDNFDEGCFYEGALSSWIDKRVDTAYMLKATPVIVTPSTITQPVFSATCLSTGPVVCRVSKKPIAPIQITALTPACVNAPSRITIADFSPYNYSYYKVDFGDPGSGTENELIGSNGYAYEGDIFHTYADTGTYTITMVVYNGDYSLSDTVSTQLRVGPQMKLTITTPEIHVCKQDTVLITAIVDNFRSDADLNTIWPVGYGWWYVSDGWGGGGLLSQTWKVTGSTLTMNATVVADTLQDRFFFSPDGFYAYNTYSNSCPLRDTLYVKVGDNKALITGNTEICKGGSTTLQASGGDSYVWSTGAQTAAITVSPTFNTTYWVEATSVDGCRDTAFVYVKVAQAINVALYAEKQRIIISDCGGCTDPYTEIRYEELSNKGVCLNDTIILYASGAQNYTWSNGSSGNTVKVLAAAAGQNTYIVTGTSGSCTDTASIRTWADSIPNGKISGPASVCYDTEFALTASGGDRYSWNLSNLQSVDYDYGNPANPVQYVHIPYTNITTYLQAIVAVSKGNCSVNVVYVPTMLAPPAINGIETAECQDYRVCPGTEVTLRKYFPLYTSNAGGFDFTPSDNPENQNLSYQWSTGITNSAPNDSVKVTVNSDTVISLTSTNGYGCSVTHTVSIYASPHFSIKKEGSAIASCGNSPTSLYLMGETLFDVEYDWGNGIKNDTLVVSPLQDSMLYVTATSQGCIRTDSILVYAQSNLPKASITGDAVVCKNIASTYTVSGNAPVIAYRWLFDDSTNPTITLSTNKDITLKAVLTFTLGCSDTAEFKIKVKEADPTLVTGNTQLCPNGTTVLTASGGTGYQWSTGGTKNKISFTTPKDSVINVIISNKGCGSDTIAISISTNKIITATLFSDEDTICAGTPLTLIAGGGEVYTWNTGQEGEQIGILPLTTTIYEVNAQVTADNCADTDSITITVKPTPSVSISAATSVCSGKNITLTATGSGNSYLWTTGATTAAITVSPVNDSTYSVSTFFSVNTFAEACSGTQSHTISVLTSTINISLGADQTIVSGTEITLIPSGGLNYNWSTVDGLLCSNCNTLIASPTKTTTYYLTETNSMCAEDSVTIYVLNCANLFVPTAFSPNNDQVNDVLYLKNDCIKEFNFKIFDRWGNIVFESENMANGWDGTFKERTMDPAVFVYYVNAIMLSGEQLNRKGNISLLK